MACSAAAAGAPPKLGDMPVEVLSSILRVAGQPARVQSMLACKALYSACRVRGTWESITFGDLDDTALNFMMRHRCSIVKIMSTTPDDIAWFLDRLADLGLDDCIQELRLDIGSVPRLPEDLLCTVARHSRLRHFGMFVDDCEDTCELTFPRTARLLDLRTMTIVENSADTKNVVVWFNGSHCRFPTLEDVNLDVGMSDVMCGLCHMPRLRRLAYHFDTDEGGELYEDVCMLGADLDVLELDINDETDHRHLFRQIEQCSVRKLVLHVHNDFVDLSHPLSPDLEHLVFGMQTTQADIHVDFQCLRTHRKLRSMGVEVAAPWILSSEAELSSCHYYTVFQHVGSVSDWVACFGRVGLDLHPTTRVCISL